MALGVMGGIRTGIRICHLDDDTVRCRSLGHRRRQTQRSRPRLDWDKVIFAEWHLGGGGWCVDEIEYERALEQAKEDGASLPTGIAANFIEAEFLRVFWGMCGGDKAEYSKVPRSGRGIALNNAQREAMLEVFDRLPPNLIHARCEARRKLAEGFRPQQFDAIVIDEAQDFTKHDLELAVALLALQRPFRSSR